MTSWATFQEPPGLPLEHPVMTRWPQSEQDAEYSPRMPWRLARYDHRGDDDNWVRLLISEHEASHLPKGFLRSVMVASQLVRFADIRQTRFKGRPNRDGTNLNELFAEHNHPPGRVESNGSADLRFMWECYADILRAIHREGQMKGGDSGTWIYKPLDELENMMDTYPVELKRREDERIQAGEPFLNNIIMAGFEWILTFSLHLKHQSASIQAIMNYASENNVDPVQYFPQAFEDIPPMMLLLMSLNSREAGFEEVLAHEHFQDILIDKRLWMISPKDFYDFGSDWPTPAIQWAGVLRHRLKPKLREFQKRLNGIFDYHMLVDWGYGRLWKKLYLFHKPINQAEKDAIQNFTTFATKHSKLAYNFFAIMPLDMTEVQADPCSVCLCDFEHDQIAMETHCNHHFHPACLFPYWDDEHRFQNRCPECRTSQGVLREKVAFEAEREDRCYESRHDLAGLEAFQLEALREALQADQSFHDSAPLMELWCRAKMEPVLKNQRISAKSRVQGWDEIK